MRIGRPVRDATKWLLKRNGYRILRDEDLYEWQRKPEPGDAYNPSDLPPGAIEILSSSNQQLKSLQQRYAAFDRSVTAPLVWHENYIRDEQIQFFRGDNGYVWQLRGQNMNPLSYVLTTYYALSIDEHGFLDRLCEDETFGNFTFQIANKIISRDLLDSVSELYFLDNHLDIASRENVCILDIGAGYGRLAHRTVTALPNVRYLCTDAVAASTFISDFYLHFRGVQDRAISVPLDQIERTLELEPVNLAVNVHSFSECRIEAIDWWLTLLATNRVQHLMIIPNGNQPRMYTNDGNDFQPIVERHGYRLMAKEPKYRDPLVQQYGINPSYYYLFQL